MHHKRYIYYDLFRGECKKFADVLFITVYGLDDDVSFSAANYWLIMQPISQILPLCLLTDMFFHSCE